MSAKTVGVLVAVAAVGIAAAAGFVGFGRGGDPAAPAAGAALPPIHHAWPPVVGEAFPAIDMRTLDGKPFDLGSLRGKVVLVETVALGSPGSVGFAGIDHFANVQAQAGLSSLGSILRKNGVDRDDPNLRTLHLLMFDSMTKAPTLEKAKRWVAETGLDQHANAIVLVGDKRYATRAALPMVPGFQLVDRNGVLRLDGAGANAPHNLYDMVFPGLAMLLNGRSENGAASSTTAATLTAPAVAVPMAPANEHARELFERLATGDYAGADTVCAGLRAAGRAEGSCDERFDLAIDQVGRFPAAIERIDAWLAARPQSAAARIASAERWIDRAWAARGGGWASKVTDEGAGLFAERLQRAERDLAAAQQLDPDQPFAAARAVTVGLGLGCDTDELRTRYRSAIAVAPRYLRAHQRYLMCLMPRWGGSFEAMAELVDGLMADIRDEPGFGLFAVAFHRDVAESSDRGAAHLRDPQTARAVQQLLADFDRAYPRSSAAWVERHLIAGILGDEKARIAATQKATELGDAARTLHLAIDNRRARRDGEGLRLLTQAAALGSVESYGRAGLAILRGEGIERNDELARAWLEAGARCDDPTSMRGLGILHENGCGVPVDLRLALQWYERAAVADSKAAEARDRMLRAHPELGR